MVDTRFNRIGGLSLLASLFAVGMSTLPGLEAARAQRAEGAAVRADAVPQKMRNRIRRLLRETYHARIVERGAARRRHADGRSTVFALYEYSAMEACLIEANRAQREDARS